LSIDERGNIGDFIGGIGVIVTLIYLAFQIRQNTIATRTDSYQAAVTSASDWSREMSLNSEIADIILRGAQEYEALEPLERMRFNLAMSSFFRNIENLHAKFRSGAVDREVWSGWANRTHAMLTGPGTRRWWELNASGFSTEFQQFVSKPIPDATYTETFWRGSPPA
jgi:hypothetical protein